MPLCSQFLSAQQSEAAGDPRVKTEAVKTISVISVLTNIVFNECYVLYEIEAVVMLPPLMLLVVTRLEAVAVST